MNYFITGIGTNVGKTIVSAIITEALQADYWKPIQSGTIEGKDSETIKDLISNTKTVIHPESYLLEAPLSPHFAASKEGVTIDLQNIKKPSTQKHLIIEGAGGILVPINNKEYVIDIAKKIDCEIILVISNYLGCINHSLLSINYLISNNYKIHSIVFNGEFETEIKNAITSYCPTVKCFDIPLMETLTKIEIKKVAEGLLF